MKTTLIAALAAAVVAASAAVTAAQEPIMKSHGPTMKSIPMMKSATLKVKTRVASKQKPKAGKKLARPRLRVPAHS